MSAIETVTSTPGLISFWTFQEPAGSPRKALGPTPYDLVEQGGVVPRMDDGVFGPYSAGFGGEGPVLTAPWLQVTRADGPALNLCGPTAQMSIVAWVKRRHVPTMEWSCQAVAGMWNEHGKRQYCMFLNLRIHDSGEQVGAHISRVGGPTEGYKYCMDAAIGATPITFDTWHCAAVTYDGTHARAYLDGQLDARGDRNPYAYPGGLFDGGPNGADFTVGAVARPERVEMVDGKPVEIGRIQANLFRGQLGGLAVFSRALTDTQILTLAGVKKTI